METTLLKLSFSSQLYHFYNGSCFGKAICVHGLMWKGSTLLVCTQTNSWLRQRPAERIERIQQRQGIVCLSLYQLFFLKRVAFTFCYSSPSSSKESRCSALFGWFLEFSKLLLKLVTLVVLNSWKKLFQKSNFFETVSANVTMLCYLIITETQLSPLLWHNDMGNESIKAVADSTIAITATVESSNMAPLMLSSLLS